MPRREEHARVWVGLAMSDEKLEITMPAAVRLLHPDGLPIDAWACPTCRVTYSLEHIAALCCFDTCTSCGGVRARAHAQLCWPCFQAERERLDAEKYSAAPKSKLSEYKGSRVFVEPADAYVEVSDVAEWIAEHPGQQHRLYGCSDYQAKLDIDGALENAVEEIEDGTSLLPSNTTIEKLREYLDQWSAEHLPGYHMVDYDQPLELDAVAP
jgi:hypothetical protein